MDKAANQSQTSTVLIKKPKGLRPVFKKLSHALILKLVSLTILINAGN